MICPNCGTSNSDTAKYCRNCGKELAMAEHKPAVFVSPPRIVVYAGFWRRVGAILIDISPLAAVNWIVGMATGSTCCFLWDAEMAGSGSAFVVGAVIGWLYFALLESSGLQATLGKMTVGLYVTDEAGRRLTFSRATGRHFGKYISGVLLGIGFLMAGFTAKKQALHDMLAGTLVMRHSPTS
jgi:uncharacterized RDD family membrane protein YckC